MLGSFARVVLVVVGVWLTGCQLPAEKAAAPVPEKQPPSSGAVVEPPPAVPESIPMLEPTGPWQGFGEPGIGRISVVVLGDIKHQGQYFLPEGANLESVYQSCGGSGGQGDFGGSPPTSVIVNRNGQETTYKMTRMTREERAAVELADGDMLSYPTRYF